MELPEGETVIGRDVTCPIRFNDSFLSRRHARFVLDADGLWVEDLGSRNGTTLNGARLEERVRVKHGDRVDIGRRSLRVNLLETTVQASDAEEVTRPDYPEIASAGGALARALAGVAGSPTQPPPRAGPAATAEPTSRSPPRAARAAEPVRAGAAPWARPSSSTRTRSRPRSGPWTGGGTIATGSRCRSSTRARR